MKKSILFIFLTALLISTTSSAASASYVSMGNLSSVSGSVIDAVVELNTTKNYGAGTITIDFMPDILKVTGVKDGSGSSIVANNTNNNKGTVLISAWNIQGTNGSIGFAIISFEAKNPGKSLLNITINTLEDIEYAEFKSSTSIINGSITVSGSQSPPSGSSGGGDQVGAEVAGLRVKRMKTS